MPAFRARQKQARAKGRYLGIGFRRSPSAPATAGRPSPRAAWTSRRAGRPSSSAMDPSGSVEVRIGASPHGQGLRRRSPRSSPTSWASRLSGSGWCTATPTARPMAGAPSPAVAGDLRRRLTARRAKGTRQAASRSRATCWRPSADIVLADGARKRRRHRPRVPIATMARAAYHQTHRFTARSSRLDGDRHL